MLSEIQIFCLGDSFSIGNYSNVFKAQSLLMPVPMNFREFAINLGISCSSINAINGSFTLPDTEAETDIDTDEMGMEPSGNLHRLVSEQYEHLHTILNKHFLSVSISVSVSGSVKRRN